MRGLFRQPMPVGTEGLLTLNYGAIDRAGWSLEVNAPGSLLFVRADGAALYP